MDHQQPAVRANRHHLKGPAGIVISEKDQTLLASPFCRKDGLGYRIVENLPYPSSPNAMLAR